MLSTISAVTICQQRYYIYGLYSPCCTSIPMTNLFYNWRFVPLSPLHLIHLPAQSLPLWQPPVCSLCLSLYKSSIFKPNTSTSIHVLFLYCLMQLCLLHESWEQARDQTLESAFYPIRV